MTLRIVPVSWRDACGFVVIAAGYRIVAERPARPGWDVPSRPREDRGVDGIDRFLWEAS